MLQTSGAVLIGFAAELNRFRQLVDSILNKRQVSDAKSSPLPLPKGADQGEGLDEQRPRRGHKVGAIDLNRVARSRLAVARRSARCDVARRHSAVAITAHNE